MDHSVVRYVVCRYRLILDRLIMYRKRVDDSNQVLIGLLVFSTVNTSIKS